MAFKQFDLDGMPIKVFKRKGNRALRLSVTAGGDVRVSIPTWVPYAAGVDFAQKKRDWIYNQLQRQPQGLLVEGQAIGKSHRLLFVPDRNARQPISRIKQTEIIVRYPANLEADDATVQKAAAKGSVRALRTQAERLLPIRLRELAQKHGYTYRTVSIKQLKSRWGSCDQRQNITLNLFLMQLPWECIDYVLLHELAHTRVMQHGPNFWQEMATVLPNVQALRKRMRTYQPILHTSLPLAVA